MKKDQNHEGFKKFKYNQILNFLTKPQLYSFAFQNNSFILFVGSGCGRIQVYGFNSNRKQIQTLIAHSKHVTCLTFAKKSNSLISGSIDKQIIIWNQNQSNQWKENQKIVLTNPIVCMILNDDENLLISAEYKAIFFWKNVNSNWCCSQILQVSAFQISLNASSTKLISCIFDKISVIELQPDQKWIITQLIQVSQTSRICFINDNQFIFQSLREDILELYSFEQFKKQFIKSQEVKTQINTYGSALFPAQFIKEKNILIVKHGRNINLFSIGQNSEILLQQSIQLDANCNLIHGRLTDDGEYLIIVMQNRMLILKLKYLE